MIDERLTNYIALIKNINIITGRGAEFTNTIDKEIVEIISENSQKEDYDSEKSFSENRSTLGYLDNPFAGIRSVIGENIRDIGRVFSEKPSWVGSMSIFKTPLQFIYEYDKCNVDAKIIMCMSKYSFDNLHERNNAYTNLFRGSDRDIENAEELVRFCRFSGNDKYKFIFWSLMILTVDKTDVEEHLSLICDYAKMLCITDNEFKDILEIIKIIYNKKETNSSYTNNISNCFKNMLKLTQGSGCANEIKYYDKLEGVYDKTLGRVPTLFDKWLIIAEKKQYTDMNKFVDNCTRAINAYIDHNMDDKLVRTVVRSVDFRNAVNWIAEEIFKKNSTVVSSIKNGNTFQKQLKNLIENYNDRSHSYF